MDRKIKVLFVSAEYAPLAKVGGLADVVGSLPTALEGLNVDARIIMPYYEPIKTKGVKTELLKKDIPIIINGKNKNFDIYHTRQQSNDVYLIYNEEFLSRGNIYSWKNHQPGGFWEKERFLFFTESVLQALPHLSFWPEIMHLNDWHTGLVPKFLSAKLTADKNFKKIKTIFTIHNIGNQGIWNSDELLPWLDMTKEDFDKEDLPRKDVNAMLFGIRHSDLLTTVSPSYAREILTKKYGLGLEKYLRKRKNSLFGILNGIDIEKFDPLTDPVIYENYDEKNLNKKTTNKIKLLEEIGLPYEKNSPLIGLVSRLVEQKGIDWVVDLVPKIKKLNAQLVVLGTGDPVLEKLLKNAQTAYPKNLKALIKYDASLAQKIYAGSDMFLIPSRFEPCGLTQMIAMRYGTIPIVRATGGLKDTVEPYKFQKNKVLGTGFLFKKEKSNALEKAVQKATKCYKNKNKWMSLQKNAMKKDFSWKKSAKKYVDLYNKLINN